MPFEGTPWSIATLCPDQQTYTLTKILKIGDQQEHNHGY